MSKLQKRTETGIFDMDIIGEEFLKPPYTGPFRLKIEYVSSKAGEAMVLLVAHTFRCPECFKWGKPLYDHIQAAAEHNSQIMWTTINASDSFQLIHH